MRSNPPETQDLVKFTEETLNGKLDFLCRESFKIYPNPLGTIVLVHVQN